MMDAWERRYIDEGDTRLTRLGAVAGILFYAVGTGVLALCIGVLLGFLG